MVNWVLCWRKDWWFWPCFPAGQGSKWNRYTSVTVLWLWHLPQNLDLIHGDLQVFGLMAGFRAWLAELDLETQFCVFWNHVLKVIFRSIQPWLFLSDAASFSLIITATTLDKCWNTSRKTSTVVLAFWAEFKRSKEKTVPGKGTFLRSSKTQTTSKMLEILESNISNKCKPFQDQAVVALN